jgi:hypothetical protein
VFLLAGDSQYMFLDLIQGYALFVISSYLKFEFKHTTYSYPLLLHVIGHAWNHHLAHVSLPV